MEAASRELQKSSAETTSRSGPRSAGVAHAFVQCGPWITQHERWFTATHAPFEVAAEHVATLAVEAVTDIRWWSSEDLAGSGFVTSPRGLADLISRVASGRLPPPDTNLGV